MLSFSYQLQYNTASR